MKKISRKDFLIGDSWLEVPGSRRNREEFFVCSSSSRKVLEEVLGGFHGKAFLGFQRFKKEFLDCLNLILVLESQRVQQDCSERFQEGGSRRKGPW